MSSRETAVFVDLENIFIGFRKQYGRELQAKELAEKARSFGGVKFINVYADFGEPTYPEWFKIELDNEGIHAVNVPKDRDRDGKPTKNKIDVRIVVDVFRSLAFRPEIDRYVFMTGDKIFLDVINLTRNDFGKDVIVSGIEGTVAQVLQEVAEYEPFTVDSDYDERLGRFIELMNDLEHRILDGTYNYLGWKLIIDQLYESPAFEFSDWHEAREFFERIKREGKILFRFYPGESREIEAYRLDRKNPLVRKVLGLGEPAGAPRR
jgi:uncharacterized LabA/DUF88 family protein